MKMYNLVCNLYDLFKYYQVSQMLSEGGKFWDSLMNLKLSLVTPILTCCCCLVTQPFEKKLLQTVCARQYVQAGVFARHPCCSTREYREKLLTVLRAILFGSAL